MILKIITIYCLYRVRESLFAVFDALSGNEEIKPRIQF